MPITGLVAAVFTPFHPDGSLNLAAVPPVVDRLAQEGVSGLFVCGTTGEGASLTVAERQQVAAAYREAAGPRLRVVVQVGHNCLADACELARHAQKIGADAIAALPPSYYRLATIEALVDSMAEVAGAAPELPFYYYHIPIMTTVEFDMVEFLQRAGDRIANLAGMKFTSWDLPVFQQCLALDNGRFDMLWGPDDMLLPAVMSGARGAVGLTYNIAAPLFMRMLKAVEAGDRDTAARLQEQGVAMIKCLTRFGGQCAVKAIMPWIGQDCGPCRLPLSTLTQQQSAALKQELQSVGFPEWRQTYAEAKPSAAPAGSR